MEPRVSRGPEAFAHCEAISDAVRRDLVRHALIVSMAALTRLDSADPLLVSLDLDVLRLAELFEATTLHPETLAALASGAPLALEEPLDDLSTRAERDGLVTHALEALARAASIPRVIVRDLVFYGLAQSLRWLRSAGDTAQAPVDLLLYTRMLELVFEPTHAIRAMAAGEPAGPWIE
jgi:hypothetical protein